MRDELQRAAMPCRFGERQREQCAEQQQQGNRRGRDIEKEMTQSKRGERGEREHTDARQGKQDGVARLPPGRRPDEQRANERCQHSLEPRCPRGTRKERVFVEILDELRVDLAAWHALADRV